MEGRSELKLAGHDYDTAGLTVTSFRGQKVKRLLRSCCDDRAACRAACYYCHYYAPPLIGGVALSDAFVRRLTSV